jgi:hypothetical protein
LRGMHAALMKRLGIEDMAISNRVSADLTLN